MKESDLDFISKHDYVTVGDFLYVRPYAFEFRANFKPRWKNKTVFEVFSDEFRHTESGYWSKEFRDGRIVCGGKPVGEDVVWQDGMEIVHIVHRHESAVLAQKIHIAHDEDGFIVVSKPPSIPVHPCGTYRRNCLQFILKAFYASEKLFAVHRLDKETSGLVILAKTSEYASRFSAEIKEHKVRKTYLAEVHGSFPIRPVECVEPILWDKREMRASIQPQGGVAKTSFRKIRENIEKNTSIVECKPLTGRTHQIRVHLARLGHGVVNDPLYGEQALLGKGGCISAAGKPQSISVLSSSFQEDAPTSQNRQTYMACEWSKRALQENGRQLSCEEEGRALCCTNCPQVTNVKNVEKNSMYIHLHALKYESDEWCFEVPPPSWATQNGENGTEGERSWTGRMPCAIS